MNRYYMFWEGVLSAEDCSELISIAEETGHSWSKGGTFSDNDEVSSDTLKNVRDSLVGWTDSEKIKKTIQHYAMEANRQCFNFDITYVPAIQYSKYTEGSFYGWHHDIDWFDDKGYDRKLSVIVQLSPPEQYSGGDFEFKHIDAPEKFRTQGSILVFPSYHVHRVTKVVQGERNSLVAWVEGPRWR